MPVAMADCGEAGSLSDRGGYRYDRIDPETGRTVVGDATVFQRAVNNEQPVKMALPQVREPRHSNGACPILLGLLSGLMARPPAWPRGHYTSYGPPWDSGISLHRHALFFVRHLYVFRVAQCKSVTIERASPCGIWRGEYTQLCAFAPRDFLLAGSDVMPIGSPEAAGIRARRPRSKLPSPLEAQGRCPPSRFRVAPSNGSHLLTHRCIPVAASV